MKSLRSPHVGVIGYYGFALLQPEWNWRWSLPPGFQYQKFIAASTLIGFLVVGFQGNQFVGIVARSSLAIGGFLALAFISAASSIEPDATAFYMDNLWKIVLMAVLGIRLIDSPGKVLALMWVLVLAQGYNAYQINLEYFEDGHSSYAYRNFGDKGDNNVYSILTVPLIACSLSLALYAERGWQKAVAATIALLQVHEIMLFESRGCMLGCLPMLAVFVWLMPKTRRTVTVLAAMLIMGAILAGPPVVEEFASAFAEEGERDSSAEGRFGLWQAGFEITKDYPVLGVGPYAGQYLVPAYFPGGLDQHAKGLHNLFFEISTGCGLPALVCYLAFFAYPAIACYGTAQATNADRWHRCASLAVVPGLVGYWTSSMFSSGALSESSYACAVVGVCATAIGGRMLEEARAEYDGT
ncbi:O-antigen ligase family protein [Posidoniimonas corsicana]|nr:O-antigen ligase family protein [Posidoniimonas corsicana]